MNTKISSTEACGLGIKIPYFKTVFWPLLFWARCSLDGSTEMLRTPQSRAPLRQSGHRPYEKPSTSPTTAHAEIDQEMDPESTPRARAFLGRLADDRLRNTPSAASTSRRSTPTNMDHGRQTFHRHQLPTRLSSSPAKQGARRSRTTWHHGFSRPRRSRGPPTRAQIRSRAKQTPERV